jgi:hypothetical protein
MNTNTNIKSEIEFPIELNEANITIRRKKSGINPNIAILNTYIVADADAAVSCQHNTITSEQNAVFENEFWKGYELSKRELKQYLKQPVQHLSKLNELRDVFKEYVDVKNLLFRDGNKSDFKAAKAKAKTEIKKKEDSLQLYSLEETREMWLQNEVKYSGKISQKEDQEYKNSSDDLDLGYYDSVPLQDRYKWDGMSSDEDEL